MRLLVLASANVIHTQRWVSYFRERGHDVALVTLEPAGAGSAQDEYILPSRASVNGIKYPLATFSLPRLIRKFRPRLVNAHYVPGYAFLASLVPTARPLAVSVWGSDLLLNAKKSLFHSLRARFALRAAGLVTCDAAVLKSALENMGVQGSRILEVPMGVERAFFHPPEEKAHPPQSRIGSQGRPFRIVSTRRLEPLYNLETLLRAAVILREAGWNFEIELIGAGSERESLEAFSNAHSMGERISFRGSLAHTELAGCLQKADIYVSTCRSDSTSVSLLEAMATGLFPVVADIEGNRQWVESGRNGLTFPPGDYGRLSELLVQVFEKKELKKKACKINLELIEKKAVWQENMKEVEEAFLKLVGG
ncbi:MAG TPA: glycosyltransferase [archaeon]|nr:glycosyltransferase [archaeon]